MPAQKQSKQNVLVGLLWELIDSQQLPTPEFVAQIESDVLHLSVTDKAYVMAWLNVAQRNHECAVECFKTTIQSGDAFFANNYLAYLGSCAHNYEHRMELFRLEEQFCTPSIRKVARNAAYCIGQERLVRKFTLKMAALRDGEEREQIISEGDYMVKKIGDFKRATQLSSAQIEKFCDDAEAIANKHGVNCIGVSYYVSSEDDNAFILRAQTQDPEVLAEMNMELIDLLLNDAYIGHPFTSWFQSVEKSRLAE